jgi:hypothetical protein
MHGRSHSLQHIPAKARGSLPSLEHWINKSSFQALDEKASKPEAKKYVEVAPNTYIYSKPMVFPETLENMKLKEFFGSKDFEKLDAMKRQLDTSVAALMKKRTTISAQQYLGPGLMMKQMVNHQERLIRLKKVKKV